MYQKIRGEGPKVPIEEKVKKVDDTVSKFQVQVEEIQLKIKATTSSEERERSKKVDEASNML